MIHIILHHAFCLPTVSSITSVILPCMSVEAAFSQVLICCQSVVKDSHRGSQVSRPPHHPTTSSHIIGAPNSMTSFGIAHTRHAKSFASDLRFRFRNEKKNVSCPQDSTILGRVQLEFQGNECDPSELTPFFKKWDGKSNVHEEIQPRYVKINQVQALPIPCATRPQHVHRTSAGQRVANITCVVA